MTKQLEDDEVAILKENIILANSRDERKLMSSNSFTLLKAEMKRESDSLSSKRRPTTCNLEHIKSVKSKELQKHGDISDNVQDTSKLTSFIREQGNMSGDITVTND